MGRPPLRVRVASLSLAFAFLAPALPTSVGVAPGPSLPPEERSLLAAEAPIPVIVQWKRAVVPVPGLAPLYVFASIPAVYGLADPASLALLLRDPSVLYVEADKPVRFLLDSATVASGVRDVVDPAFEPSTPPLAASGEGIDGRGVGIAVVDTGLDGTHPDFASLGKVGGNWFVTPGGLVPSAYTATGSLHGTHVAGIAAGTGLSSAGLYRGAAPGATLYALGVGAGTSIAFPSIAFDWLLQNGAALDPPVRIVTNSWQCVSVACTTFNPSQVHSRLATLLVESGVVVVFAAGNEGGGGSAAMTSAESQNPAPGLLGVGAYDDRDTGTTTGCPPAWSSRGDAHFPATWPDLVAPGNRITSTVGIGPDGTARPRHPDDDKYAVKSGTSMSAPLVAGVVALVLQANPELAPRDVEYLLKSTARKLPCGVDSSRSDPAHPYDPANYQEGHGLVDAYAAVGGALSFSGIPPAPPAEPLPPSYAQIP